MLNDETWVRAARELLRWDQSRLAREAGLSLVTVKRYESGRETTISDDTVELIKRTLEKAGVVFHDPGKVDGVKVVAAIALRASARPEPRPDKRVYDYKSATRGRPRKATSDEAS